MVFGEIFKEVKTVKRTKKEQELFNQLTEAQKKWWNKLGEKEKLALFDMERDGKLNLIEWFRDTWKPSIKFQTGGKCYESAFEYIRTSEDDDNILVHGSVYSTALKMRIDHAWIEKGQTGQTVIDNTIPFKGSRIEYYPMSDPEIEDSYEPDLAAELYAMTEHCGPWTKKEKEVAWKCVKKKRSETGYFEKKYETLSGEYVRLQLEAQAKVNNAYKIGFEDGSHEFNFKLFPTFDLFYSTYAPYMNYEQLKESRRRIMKCLKLRKQIETKPGMSKEEKAKLNEKLKEMEEETGGFIFISVGNVLKQREKLLSI